MLRNTQHICERRWLILANNSTAVLILLFLLFHHALPKLVRVRL